MADRPYSEIAAEYRPHHMVAAFQRGAEDYDGGVHTCPFSTDSVDAQTAWPWPISPARSSLFAASVLISATLLFSSQPALAQFTQQGPKLVGNGTVGAADQG
jgi:hypothetical protein